MATSFPTSLDSLTNPGSAEKLNSPSHSGQHSDENDAIEALETKVGIDSSGVATSFDYLLKNVLSVNPGHGHPLTKITGVNSSTADINLLLGLAAYGISTIELHYLDGLTSTIQSQLDGKMTNVEIPTGTVDGLLTTFTVSNTPKVVIIDGLIRRSTKGYTFAGGIITTDSLTPPVYDIFSIY